MKGLKFISLTALLLMFSIKVFGATKPYYVLNMMKIESNHITKIKAYELELEDLVKKYHGTLQLPKLNVEEQLIYENSPKNIVPFNYTYFFLIKFNSKKEAKQLLLDETYVKGKNYFKNHTIVLSKTMKGLPGIPEFPLIQRSDIKSAPSFVLFNPFSMKKTPGAMIKMLKYFKRVTPKVSAVGTQFFSAFRPKKVIKGAFEFDMLFLTVWKDMDAFNSIHYSDYFSENVYLRNESLKSLGEAKGILE